MSEPPASAQAQIPDLRIEYRALAALKRAPRNPKEHDLGALHLAFERHGYRSPVLLGFIEALNEEMLVAGHGRLEALEQRKASGKEPPAGIRLDPSGDWLVPTVVGLRFATIEDAEAYLVADNRLTSLGGYNDSMLADVLISLAKSQKGLAGVGYDEDDLSAMLKRLGGEGGPGLDEMLGKLPAAAPGFHQMAFSLSTRQLEIVSAAIEKAKEKAEQRENPNSNGNALEVLSAAYLEPCPKE